MISKINKKYVELLSKEKFWKMQGQQNVILRTARAFACCQKDKTTEFDSTMFWQNMRKHTN